MKKEDLIELGYTEEQAKEIMGLHGRTVTRLNKELEQIQTQVEAQEVELDKRDKDIKLLKRETKDYEDVNAKLTTLQQEYKQLAEQKDTETKLNAIDLAIIEAKGKNPKAIRALIDEGKVTYDNNTLLGLKEQLENLVETDSYLFEGGDYKPPKGNKDDPLPDISKLGTEGVSIDDYIGGLLNE